MIRNGDIEKFYADVDKLGLKYPVAEIARATKYSKGNVSQYLKRKMEPSESFMKKFYAAFPESSKKVAPSTVEEPDPEYRTRTDRMLFNLSESIRAHAEATLLRERNYSDMMSQITENAPVETPQAFESIVAGFRELIIDLGLGKKWDSRQEGAAIVRSKLYGPGRQKKSDGIRNG